MGPWLTRLRHDLLKHPLWWARDLRDLGQQPRAADLRAFRRSMLEMNDDEGNCVTALALWQKLRVESDAPAVALDDFERAIAAAESAVFQLDPDSRDEEFAAAVTAVLNLETAFLVLSDRLAPPNGASCRDC
jgi:hypothetical protein